MKYLIYSDLEELKKCKKIIICYLLMLVLYYIYNGIILDFDFNSEKSNIFLTNIGGFQKIYHPIVMAYTLFIFAIYYYIALKLFVKDFKLGAENIFLRISQKKWLNIKLFNIFIITFILEILTFVILLLLFFITGNSLSITSIFTIFIADLFTKMLFINLSIIGYILFNYYGIFIFLLIIIISSIGKIYNLGFYLFSINFLDNYFEILIYFVLSLLLLKFIFIRKNNLIFERRD